MSTTTASSVRLPALSQLWPRARRLLALACIAALGAALVSATSAPHVVAAAIAHVQQWMTGISQTDVFLGLVALFVIAVVVAVATAIDHESKREIFDVR